MSACRLPVEGYPCDPSLSKDCGCRTTLPTVTVTPISPGASAYLVQAPGLPFSMAHRVPNGWKQSRSRGATHESLFALVDDYMAGHGVQEYQLDARAVVGAA